MGSCGELAVSERPYEEFAKSSDRKLYVEPPTKEISHVVYLGSNMLYLLLLINGGDAWNFIFTS